MILVKDKEILKKSTEPELKHYNFRNQLKGATIKNDLSSLIALKLRYIDEHCNIKDTAVKLHRDELEKLETLSSAKNFLAVGGNSWFYLSKMLDSYDGCFKINDFFAKFIDFPFGGIDNLIFFVDDSANNIYLKVCDGNKFIVFPNNL